MARFKLTTLSPVHIGSGRVLSYNTEYLNFPKYSVCSVIDEQKVLNVIGHDEIDTWVSIIENQEDLLDYLYKRKQDLKPEDVASRVLKGKVPRNTRVSLREQLFAGNGKPLIPGSSLKGPIRTAYLNTQLEQKFGKDSIPDNYLLTEDPKTGEQKVATDKALQKEIFGNNPNKDIFRFVRVYDAMPDCATEVYPGVLMNYDIKNDEWYRDNRPMHLVEVIPKGVEMEFNIELKEPPKQFDAPFPSFEAMFAQINGVTSAAFGMDHEDAETAGSDIADQFVDQLDALNTQIEKLDQSRGCIMRVGFGSGWLFMTGRWPYDQDLVEDEIFDMIRKKVQIRDYPEDSPFPKTRKLVEGGTPLGFVKLEKVD